MKLRTDIEGQAHHLNQNAIYGEIIPSGDAASVKLPGDAIRESGTPHYEVHRVQEQYLDQFRSGGSQVGQVPTNLQMNRASLDALKAAGYTKEQAMSLMRAAVKDRVDYGLLGGEEIPRLPRRINQVKPDDEH